MKFIKNKKGFLPVFLAPILVNPLFWLGTGIFILVIYLLSLFMLGKILGAVLIVSGIWLFAKTENWIVLVFAVLLGVILFWNPFDFGMLQFIRG